jgi:hypothetical protein
VKKDLSPRSSRPRRSGTGLADATLVIARIEYPRPTEPYLAKLDSMGEAADARSKKTRVSGDT